MLCINADAVLLIVLLRDATPTEFRGEVFFRILCVNVKAVLRLGMTPLLPLGDDFATGAGDEDWSFRRGDRNGEALLLPLLLLGEDTDEDKGKRTSLGIAAVVADAWVCLIFEEADNTPMRQSGGNTSLTTNTTSKTSWVKNVKQKNWVPALSMTPIQNVISLMLASLHGNVNAIN